MTFIATLLVACLAWTTPDATRETVLDRLVVIGASASAGLAVVVATSPEHQALAPEDTVLGITHRHVDLADVLDAVFIDLPAPVLGLGNTRFFMSPHNIGTGQVDTALAADATGVVAIDFLFWFGYGYLPRGTIDASAQRMAQLERGFKQIERFDVSVYVGNLPDVADAVDAEPFAMLQKGQVPSPESLVALNERIRDWAGQHEHVHLIDLHGHVERVNAGEPLTLGGHTWSAETDLVQFDELHPSLEGLIAVGEIIAEAIHRQAPDAEIQTDPAAVITTLSRAVAETTP